MAYKIIASQCTVCGACEFECPNAAISLKRDMYVIDPKKCTEREGHFDTAKCAVVCPVPVTCIPAWASIDEAGCEILVADGAIDGGSSGNDRTGPRHRRR